LETVTVKRQLFEWISGASLSWIFIDTDLPERIGAFPEQMSGEQDSRGCLHRKLSESYPFSGISLAPTQRVSLKTFPEAAFSFVRAKSALLNSIPL
jgi:hypothetical protein